jgi:hypothetical protein
LRGLRLDMEANPYVQTIIPWWNAAADFFGDLLLK